MALSFVEDKKFPKTSFEVIALSTETDSFKLERERQRLREVVSEIVKFEPEFIDIAFIVKGAQDVDGLMRQRVFETIQLVREIAGDTPLGVHTTARAIDIAGIDKFINDLADNNVHRHVLVTGDPLRDNTPRFAQATPMYENSNLMIKRVAEIYKGRKQLHLLKTYVAVEDNSYMGQAVPALAPDPVRKFAEKIDAGIIIAHDGISYSTVAGGIMQYRYERGGYAALLKKMRDAGIEQDLIPGYVAATGMPNPKPIFDYGKNEILVSGKKVEGDRLRVPMTEKYIEDFVTTFNIHSHLGRDVAIRETGIELSGEAILADRFAYADMVGDRKAVLPWVHGYTMNDSKGILAAVAEKHPGINSAQEAQRGGPFIALGVNSYPQVA